MTRVRRHPTPTEWNDARIVTGRRSWPCHMCEDAIMAGTTHYDAGRGFRAHRTCRTPAWLQEQIDRESAAATDFVSTILDEVASIEFTDAEPSSTQALIGAPALETSPSPCSGSTHNASEPSPTQPEKDSGMSAVSDRPPGRREHTTTLAPEHPNDAPTSAEPPAGSAPSPVVPAAEVGCVTPSRFEAYARNIARLERRKDYLDRQLKAIAAAADPKDLKTVRASSLPMAFSCAGSVRPLGVRVDSDVPLARLGSAVHGVLEGTDPDDAAMRWLVSVDDVRPLVASAQKVLKRIAPAFPDPSVESYRCHTLPGTDCTLTGHIDLLQVSGSVALVMDWKTGYLRKDFADQLKAYAWLVCQDHPEVDRVGLYVAWLRYPDASGVPEIEGPLEVTRAELDEWARRLVADVVKWNGTYRTSVEWCPLCPLKNTCPAWDVEARALVRWAADDDAAGTVIGAPAETVVELRRRFRWLAKMSKDGLNLIRKRVQDEGDIVSEHHGARIRSVTEQRQSIDLVKAWPVIQQLGLSQDAIARSVVVKNGAFNAAIREAAGEGGKAAVSAAWKDLHAAGAVTRTTFEKVMETKV